MLTVAGREAGDGKVGGGSVLDEIGRGGARRMLLAALETEVTAYLEHMPPSATATAMPWWSGTARAGRGTSRSDQGRSP